jgi:hypothetical protein
LTSTDFRKIKRYPVAPLDMRLSQFETIVFPAKPSFESKIVICSYVLRMPDDTSMIPTFVVENLASDNPGIIELTLLGDNRFQLMIDSKFEDEFLEEAIMMAKKML